VLQVSGAIRWQPNATQVSPNGARRRPPRRAGGRPAIDLERMLRIYFLQQWFNLSDPTVEEALYDSRAMEAFARIDLVSQFLARPRSASSVICSKAMVWARRCSKKPMHIGLKMVSQSAVARSWARRSSRRPVRPRTLLESAIRNAPNDEGPRVAFGMKAHIGMDRKVKIVHSFAAAPANVHDSHLLPELLHGDETRVCGDAACRLRFHASLFGTPARPLQTSARPIAAKPASGPELSMPSRD
jgi:IS5 family transposase